MPAHVARGNARRGRIRARVEHVFAQQKRRLGLLIRSGGLARATTTITLANLACNMRRLTWPDGRGAPAWHPRPPENAPSTAPVCSNRQNPFRTPSVIGRECATAEAAVDQPERFRSSKSVGACFGARPRRYHSGDSDRSGAISKAGDASVRVALFEAAHVMMTRVAAWSAPKAWAMAIARRRGAKRAKVARARKLAIVMHRMWIDGTDFHAKTMPTPVHCGETATIQAGNRDRPRRGTPAQVRPTDPPECFSQLRSRDRLHPHRADRIR
jgi:hypothetical protein